jgi:VWFA-related protein
MPVVTALCLAAATVLHSQQSQEQPPTFRSAIEAVQFNVYVTDAAGNPVNGLTIDDFELIENNVPQPITTFEAIDIPIERGESLERVGLAEPDVLSNDGPPGRAYVFAIDDLDGCAALRTRRFLRQFLDDFFGPDDIAAVALVGRGLVTDGQDFTRNRRLLLNAVDKISGEGAECSAPREPGDARTSGRSQQMASLRDLIGSLVNIPGRHKAMLFFTHGPAIDMGDIIDYNGGVLGLAGDDAHAAMAAATRSNIRIYPMDPSGLMASAVSLATKSAFRSLGEATGGFALVDSNSFTETFERIVRENSTYYMVGFNSAYEKDDGKYVRVQVRVKRPGLIVNARGGYVAPTRKLRQEQERARAKAPTSAVAGALASPLPTNGVPLRVFATSFKGRGKDAVVALAVELKASTLDLDDVDGALRGSVDVRYVATDAKKKVYPEVARTASIEVKPDVPGRAPLEKIQVRVVSELQLPAGRYQLRVAAGTDVLAGNVIYDLDVPDFSDGVLAMSGLMLVAAVEPMVLTLNSASSARASRSVKCLTLECRTPTSADAPEVSLTPGVSEPMLRSGAPGAPTTRREFSVGDELMLFTEVYDNSRRRQQNTRMVLTLTASLHDANGKEIPLATDQQPVSTVRDGVVGHAFKVNVTVPDVPEGAYVLRVQARSSTDEKAVALREIPVRVR